MTAGSDVAVAVLVVLVLLPAMLGLVFERVRASRPRVEVLMNADHARARATLAYFNDVHDSHSG
jgi:hypothetical protein